MKQSLLNNMQNSRKIGSVLSLALIALSSFVIANPVYAGPAISVDFETAPLFHNLNTTPGDTTTRWVTVTNHTPDTRIIGVKALNTYDCSSDAFCLADILKIDIRDGSGLLYSNSLSAFYTASAVDGIILSSLAGNDAMTKYDITVSFPTIIGNDYQGLTTFFDLEFGFISQTTGTGGGIVIQTSSSGGGGGGGSSFAPLLHIQKSGDAIVVPGGTGNYILTVSNLGLAAATNVLVTDTLPIGFSFAPPLTGTLSTLGGHEVQTWTIPILGAHSVQTVNYSVLIPADATGTYTNNALVSTQGATTGSLYDDDLFNFSAITVAGFSYIPPADSNEAAPTSNAVGTPPTQHGSLDTVKVLGFEALPVTGGDLLSYFGIGKHTEPLSPEKHSLVSQYIAATLCLFFIVILVVVRLLLKRSD